jgi:hydrogenase nickel incorporation protein HypB
MMMNEASPSSKTDEPKTPRILQVRTKILKANDTLARTLREKFASDNVFVTNWVSSPGSGKTTWLERTLKELPTKFPSEDLRVAAIVGDLETDRDAQRLRRSGAPVRQIMTHGLCHLEADMIEREWDTFTPKNVDFLFIENVGNLVCPTSWDLGESLRIGLFSVTEGEDKPLKYPGLFNTCDAVLLTKIDLAQACEFQRDSAIANLNAVRPGIKIFEVSGKTGQGLEDWLDWLIAQRETWQASIASTMRAASTSPREAT